MVGLLIAFSEHYPVQPEVRHNLLDIRRYSVDHFLPYEFSEHRY
jgi:hypothetical protein